MLHRIPSFLAAALLIGAGLAADPALGATGPGDGPHVRASLVAESKGLVPGQILHIALRQEIQPGWHTYWINPGDSGLATTLDWKLPDGFAADPIEWPIPGRIAYGPLVSYGYEGNPLLPVALHVPQGLQPGTNVDLKAHATWLACAEVCVPEEADLALTLPVSAGPAAPDPDWGPAIAAARAALPAPSPFAATATVDHDRLRLHLAAGDTRHLDQIAFYPLDSGVIDNTAPQAVAVGADGLSLTIPRGELKTQALSKLDGILAFRDKSAGDPAPERAIRISAQAVPGALDAPAEAGLGIASVLLLALLGGLVLNLMPCVLPILSIKALGLIKHGGEAPAEVRRQGYAYTAGVLVSFALVAGAMLALRAAGEAIGWGFQLQSPGFVTAMLFILFAVGLNLSGVFSIGESVVGLGSGLASRPGIAGAFFTGALSTLVATPCTAPFMAAAVGYAIAQPWYVALAIFETVALGLALPYLLLTLLPAARRMLPKPGRWMDVLKQALAFPVYATVAWLLTVLAGQAGSLGVAEAAGGLVLVGFAAWLYDATRDGAGFGRRLGQAAIAASVAALVAIAATLGGDAGATTSSQAQADGPWQRFTAAALDTARAQGHPVFVDFTADWCITCKVNEHIALSDPAVRRAFTDAGVVALRGDWTRRDGEITRILEAHGRAGVPLYLYYRPGAEPVVLPQILTPDTVLEQIKGG